MSEYIKPISEIMYKPRVLLYLRCKRCGLVAFDDERLLGGYWCPNCEGIALERIQSDKRLSREEVMDFGP